MFELCKFFPKGTVLFSSHVEFTESDEGTKALKMYAKRLSQFDDIDWSIHNNTIRFH